MRCTISQISKRIATSVATSIVGKNELEKSRRTDTEKMKKFLAQLSSRI